MLDRFSLKGKVVLITGASRGLGQGMAVGLAKAGADIFALGVSAMTETKELVEKEGRRFDSAKADLVHCSVEDLASYVKAAVDHMGHVDVLVNNAGIIRREDSIQFTEKDWDEVMDINIKKVFFLSQAFVNQLLKQGKGGKIINIASMLSFQGGIRVPSYTASKSGIRGLTMSMANEWASHGINVNAIAPGYMATDNTKDLRNNPERSAQILDRIPAGRWGTPEDLAGTCVFLAGDNSNYINGYTIAVDGGWLAR
ncbi:2-dehydro-3-deoxy-D-gluconate 5-dehydrogenase KduD [Spirochaeta cellobiosiphila]|uniref:2-dehydro-3-deoxy-D-gluconate 5-dehydrogenase KduD n=1 Tax=Spirochaeta cellobiosiphila TaxID=504483 RepID=UPI000407BA8D|nr:2-dehydro-3-deoxy-D-gluconate 5-dehydrogenase KduD [Spirochaeta cellobiosiphila]